ncbi:MAG: YIP1 family protein [Anaerolineae bacterium]|nr:YIP1 family protein [Anaerolineae bacterium]
MQSIAALVPRALLFDGDAYLEIKIWGRPAREGARLVLGLGAVLGIAGTLAGILGWATAPALADVRRVLTAELAALPLLQRFGPLASRVAAALDWPPLWAAAAWVHPTPLLALMRLAIGPAGLLMGWLAYGLAAHAAARLLGGRARLELTLGCLALAEAPRLLLILAPSPGLAWLGVWAWVLAARFQALRAAHGLDGWRAFWAALMPVLVAICLGGAALTCALAVALAGVL